MLMTVLAAMLAVATVELLIPIFNSFAGVNLDSNLIANPTVVVTILAVTLSVGIFRAFFWLPTLHVCLKWSTKSVLGETPSG